MKTHRAKMIVCKFVTHCSIKQQAVTNGRKWQRLSQKKPSWQRRRNSEGKGQYPIWPSLLIALQWNEDDLQVWWELCMRISLVKLMMLFYNWKFLLKKQLCLDQWNVRYQFQAHIQMSPLLAILSPMKWVPQAYWKSPLQLSFSCRLLHKICLYWHVQPLHLMWCIDRHQ